MHSLTERTMVFKKDEIIIKAEAVYPRGALQTLPRAGDQVILTKVANKLEIFVAGDPCLRLAA